MHALETLYADTWMRVTRMQASASGVRRVLLSFTGVGHAMGGIDVQSPEFAGAGSTYDAVFFISDLTRSWGNRLDFAQLDALIAEAAPGAERHCIGNSMGGFLALLAPSLMPVSQVLAFAPQFSVDPSIVPWERRWEEYRNGIDTWRFPSLKDCWQDQTRYHVLIGALGIDRRHAALFPTDLPNLLVTKVPARHDLAAELKTAGVLRDVIQKTFAGTFTPAWFEQAYGARPLADQQNKDQP